MSEFKLFCIYHKPSVLFEKDWIVPIQTGVEDSEYRLGILCDNEGDNISSKNKNYGEITAQYWVWKNYLAQNPGLKHVGFCHYRRFLDFFTPPCGDRCFNKSVTFVEFSAMLDEMDDSKVGKVVDSYDIILPEYHTVTEGESIYRHFVDNHPAKEIDALMEIIREDYPEYAPGMDEYLNGNQGYFCLNFVMKRELFEDYISWMTDILAKLEAKSDWSKYSDYKSVRAPAFLAERFFNVWLIRQKQLRNLRILERKSYLLTDLKKTVKCGPFVLDKQNNKRTLRVFGKTVLSFEKFKYETHNKIKVGKYAFSYRRKKRVAERKNLLVATLLVRDEIDIVEQNIEHHLRQGVDFLIATDNGSVDGTREVLQKYADMGRMHIIDEPDHNYNQVAWVDRMIKIARDEYNATWIMNLDADEFYYTQSGNLKRELEALAHFNCIAVPSLFIFPGREEGFLEPFYMNTRGLHKRLCKCIHTAPDYEMIHMGGHDVDMRNKRHAITSGISIFHFHMRSYDRFERKVRISGEAMLLKKDRKPGEGYHTLKLYEMLKNGELRQEYERQCIGAEDVHIVDTRLRDYYENGCMTNYNLFIKQISRPAIPRDMLV